MPRHSTRPRSAPVRDIPDPDDLTDGQRARREAIVAAAATRMVTTDFADISVTRVAADADVALGTLYRYFSSKDHLMACALLAWSSDFADRVNPSSSAPPADRVAATIRRAARAFEREPRVYETLLQIQASRDPNAAEVYSRFADRQFTAFDASLDDAEADARHDVSLIMAAVLSEALRSRHAGSCSWAEVYRRIDRAAALVTAGVRVAP